MRQHQPIDLPILAVRSVLVVEDNYDDFEILENHLADYKGKGLLLEHCDCLDKALIRLRSGGIDIVFLDLNLPDSQGVETFTTIHLAVPSVPIVVLSGSVDIKTAMESLKLGAEDYLIKDTVDTVSLGRSLNYALARHVAREAQERLATIVEASDDAIIGQTLEGTITSWNKGASRLFGYSEKEATGKSVAMIIPPELPNELTEILESIEKGEAIRNRETVRVKKDGTRLDIAVTVSPIVRRDGSVGGVAAIERDITERKLEQQVLKESEERFRLLVSSVKDYAIFMLDPSGIVTSWNEGAEELKGYQAAEIIGKHYSIFFTNEDQLAGVPDRQLKFALVQGSFQSEEWRVRKNGSRLFADVVITPLFDQSGVLIGFTKITHDVTAQKLAQREIADARLRLSMALEAAAVAVWDFDLTQQSVWRSARHDEIFGHEDPLPIWNFDIFATYVLPEDLASATEAFRFGLKHGQFRMQCRIIRANDKALRWISARGETFHDDHGRPIRMMGTVADITDIKEQQEQQHMLSIMEEREDFMATLTHDLKNPLLGADRLLEMLVAGTLGKMTDEQCEMLENLRESNAGLLKLIRDLIDVYRFKKDANELIVVECDLVNTIAMCVNRITPFADLRSVKVITQLPKKAAVRADASRLERVLHNLLDNAMKFVPDGGTIKVRAFSEELDTIIEIEDNGPGIRAEDHSRLFERFAQGSAGKRYTGGSGLGLYLCKRIVEAHGGNISCQSRPNEATIFRICLPSDSDETKLE